MPFRVIDLGPHGLELGGGRHGDDLPPTPERRTLRKLLITIALTAGILLLSIPAAAMSWGPNSSYYKGTRRVTGSGNFYNADHTYARNKMVIRDDRNDGNNVYGTTVFSFYGYRCDPHCESRWRTGYSKSTREFANSTRTYWVSTGLSSWADRARGKSYACAQMGWPVPDSCATPAYPSFSY